MDDLFDDLRWRGLVDQSTMPESIGAWLAGASRTLYAGFDPTSDSLHVGSLLPLVLLRRFQKAGHRPIALVGGATGMIGDPSGKSDERNLLSVEKLRENVAGIGRQMQSLLDFDAGDVSARLVNNYDWMGRLPYLDFLREVGKQFSVNAMLAKESVKNRIDREEAGISYTEFSYMLIQAYDFVHLHREYGCELQIGGSDQWGNITAGIDLGRRMCGAKLQGITAPLLLKSDGSKMGKTEDGALWLAPERTSPYQFFQYWINVDDADAGACLRRLTELDREEILALDQSRADQPHRRESQRRLAETLTLAVHGPEGLAAAKRATEVFFGAEIRGLSDRQLAEIFADVPSKELPHDRLAGNGMSTIDALLEAGLADSRGEARRLISGGGVYVNNQRVGRLDHMLTGADLASETVLVLRSGKKKYALLRFVQ